MNLEEKNYIENQVTNRSKQMSVAYILWFFLGGLGGHRFYLGKTGSAVGLLILTLVTAWFTFGIPTIIWLIIDACLIPGMIEENKEKVRRHATEEVSMMNHNSNHNYNPYQDQYAQQGQYNQAQQQNGQQHFNQGVNEEGTNQQFNQNQ